MSEFAKIGPARSVWASSFRLKSPLLDRMDRKSKTTSFWKWLQVLDSREISGTPGEIRTPDPLLRGQKVNVKSDSSYSFQFNEMARPGRLELPTLCLEGMQ